MKPFFFSFCIVITVAAWVMLIDATWGSSLQFIPKIVISTALIYAVTDVIIDFVEKIKKHYRP